MENFFSPRHLDGPDVRLPLCCPEGFLLAGHPPAGVTAFTPPAIPGTPGSAVPSLRVDFGISFSDPPMSSGAQPAGFVWRRDLLLEVLESWDDELNLARLVHVPDTPLVCAQYFGFSSLFDFSRLRMVAIIPDETKDLWGKRGCAFHKRSSMLVTCGKQGSLVLWKVDLEQVFQEDDVLIPKSDTLKEELFLHPGITQAGRLLGHADDPTVAAVSPAMDSNWLVSGSTDESCILWDLEKREALGAFTSPDHQRLGGIETVGIDEKSSIIFSGGREVRLWDPVSFQQTHFLDHTDYVVYSGFYCPPRHSLVIGGDEKMNIWDLRYPKTPIECWSAHSDGISSCCTMDTTGGLFATCSEDDYVKMWNYDGKSYGSAFMKGVGSLCFVPPEALTGATERRRYLVEEIERIAYLAESSSCRLAPIQIARGRGVGLSGIKSILAIRL